MCPRPNGREAKFEGVLYESRAVRVASCGINIKPTMPFIHALIHGSVTTDDGYSHPDIVQSVGCGFLKPRPEKNSTEGERGNFHLYTSFEGTYVIANHLQASCYHAELRKRGTFAELPFNSAADVLLEIIPRIRLHHLICPILSPVCKSFLSPASSILPLPHELCWTTCFISLFGRGSGTQNSTETGLGKPDFTCSYLHARTNIIIEAVMSYRPLETIQEHADRFILTDKHKSYRSIRTNGFKCFRGLVIIGRDLEETKNKMKGVDLKDSNSDLQIMGLCPLSGYHSMVFILRTSERCKPYTIACNLVPQRLIGDDLAVGHTFGKSCVHLTRVPHLPLPLSLTLPNTHVHRVQECTYNHHAGLQARAD